MFSQQKWVCDVNLITPPPRPSEPTLFPRESASSHSFLYPKLYSGTSYNLEWLYKPYVLSDALHVHYPLLDLELFCQTMGTIYPDELEKLKESNPKGLIREIGLYSPCSGLKTLGRVIIPTKTYLANKAVLDNLRTEPIGKALLYDNPFVKRSGFEFCRIDKDSIYASFIERVAPTHTCFYARRSIFWIKENPLLVIEFFLSGLPIDVPELPYG